MSLHLDGNNFVRGYVSHLQTRDFMEVDDIEERWGFVDPSVIIGSEW